MTLPPFRARPATRFACALVLALAACADDARFSIPVDAPDAELPPADASAGPGDPDTTAPPAEDASGPPDDARGDGGDPDAADAEPPPPEDTGPTTDPDASPTDIDAPPVDAPEDGSETYERVPVGHDREFRGVWIATVSNINFPSRTGLSPDALRAELDALIDIARDAGINAIVFQVRPEGDALYASTIEPWSRFLTGTQGGDPGVDPLAYLLERAHAQAIEVHAWLNPYRAKSNRNSAAVAPHLSVVAPSWAYPYGSSLWMDPGAEVVQQRLVDVIEDLVDRYPLDGIHFDDYFYPYPDGPFPDDPSWTAYQASGGSLSRDDWRRDNVNRMVRRVHERLLSLDPSVRFGISPFGIYRPGIPPGIRGLDQYASIFADPVRWMEEGWLDYVAPQLYWPTTQTAQAYETLLAWWVQVHPRIHVFAGTYLSRLGDNDDWTVDEFREQVRLSRAYRAQGSLGNIHFQIGPLMQNRSGIRDVFRDELHARPALTPPLGSAEFAEVHAPDVAPGDTPGTWRLTYRDPVPQRAWTVYRDDGAAWILDRIVPASTDTLTLEAGRWAIAAVSRQGVESEGVVVVHTTE